MDKRGGAAGSAKGRGYVYCMRDGKKFKIGCSSNPEQRLKAIKKQPKHKNTTLLCKVKATEMNRAESAAQARAQNTLGLKKTKNSATDWFKNPKQKPVYKIKKAVKTAVYDHNKKQKQK